MDTSQNRQLEKRFWELDLIRGLAVVMMIIFHVLFDLDHFGNFDIVVGSGFWHLFAIVTASLFIVLVGISLTLSFARAKMMYGKNLSAKYLKRGAKIFSLGLIITIITWFAMGEYVIIFGILHFIGISIILAYPFLRFRLLNLFLGVAVITLGLLIKRSAVITTLLLPLGFSPVGFYSMDYFPLIPWFGLVLVGIYLGNSVYHDFSRRFQLPDYSDRPVIRGFCFLGRNSLVIYLIHQPVLIVSMYVVGLVTIPF
jgi:uncharacterized membrane protein